MIEEEDRAARLGPIASEGDFQETGKAKGLSLRAVLPNAITVAALCAGLTGIRFAISGEWASAVMAIVIAGVLDGLDGRIARLLKAQSRFGAELDSLADSLSFGMAPAIVLYLWSLQELPRLGWFAALAFAIACALRLARFNAQIDVDEQPHKSAGFLTGVPAPAGAGLAFTPVYLWLATGGEWEFLRDPIIVGPWMALIAVLMISNMATLSWTSLRPRRNIRLEVIFFIGLLFAALLVEPWWTLAAICIAYLALMPYGLWRYSRIKQQRAAERDRSIL
ncbi:MAG: phosphatidylcholine/phosphatidylserine synthase [Sphingomonadaceae bacterium]|nr:MAG: phosphatidylcholine/phosphatidylserine synthase [Sphingomonadaceae bacterium]